MKAVSIILVVITGLSMLSSLVCGLWIKANQITDISSLNFHKFTGIASVVLTIVMAVLLLVLAGKL